MCISWQALSKTLTVDELFYLKEQFALLEPNKNGSITLDSVKMVGLYPTLGHLTKIAIEILISVVLSRP